jgi:hypothetical protein
MRPGRNSREKVHDFLAARRGGVSRERAAGVLQFLSGSVMGDIDVERLDEESRKRFFIDSSKIGGGWVRQRDLKEIVPHDMARARLLKDLVKGGLVERRARQGTQYYRASAPYPKIWFIPREELEVDDEKAWQTVGRLSLERNHLIALLQEHGIEDPLAVVRERIEEGKEAYRESLRKKGPRREPPVPEDLIKRIVG